ncbi:MAG TPA: hypothetical protein VFX96_16780 [Pyrinomonadaceae bacterium]|nr:hypothetical protein [Pyrinomonadaceae bacterium]
MRTLTSLLLVVTLLNGSPSVGNRFRVAAQETEAAQGGAGQIPTVDFCDVFKSPRLYFDKTVRLTATYQMGHETAYLIDELCGPSLRTQFGVGFVYADEGRRDVIRRDVDKIASGEFGNGRARVTVVGVLRDAPDRGFGGYRYRFDIMRFEDISREDASRTINAYAGTLEAGMHYRAKVRGDRRLGLSLVPPFRAPMHHAVRFEWTNLGEFRALRRLRHGSREREIVFTVVSDEIERVAERRWNRTLRFKVIAVE